MKRNGIFEFVTDESGEYCSRECPYVRWGSMQCNRFWTNKHVRYKHLDVEFMGDCTECIRDKDCIEAEAKFKAMQGDGVDGEGAG